MIVKILIAMVPGYLKSEYFPEGPSSQLLAKRDVCHRIPQHPSRKVFFKGIGAIVQTL